MIIEYVNRTYRITYGGVSLVENALEDPRLVQVSVVEGTRIMVAPRPEYGISYLPNGEFRSWELTGVNTRLTKIDKHFIYARLNRDTDKAMILFSVNDYAFDGRVNGGEEGEYYYIKIGSITDTDNMPLPSMKPREITFDFGYLATPGDIDSGKEDWKKLFELTVDDLIRPLKRFTSFVVQGTLRIIGKIILNDKEVNDIARQGDEDAGETNDETIPTTAYLDGKFLSRLRRTFLNKDREDQTEFLQKFLGGIEAEHVSTPDIHSPEFVDGLFGEGWRAFYDEVTKLASLTTDKLTVRQSMVVLELLIQKARSVGGMLVVSSASGKVSEVVRQGDSYRIVFETENMFLKNDLIRCATFEGGNKKDYWVEVSSTLSDAVLVPVSEFNGNVPVVGDEIVLMGNTTNTNRQNFILISAAEDGQPRIDILNGVNSKSLAGCLRTRLGCLDGIKSSVFPPDKQPKGHGLFSDNAYLKGEFILATGEDVLTRFEITEGKIHSAVEGLREEVQSEQSYFNNSSFVEGMESWSTAYKTAFLTFGGKWIWANGGPISSKAEGGVSLGSDGKKAYVQIRNSFIMQKNKDFRLVPEYRNTNSEGKKVAGVVFLSFRYKVIKAGKLTIEFINTDVTGFEDFDMFHYEADLPVTGAEKMFSFTGYWNGTGDFKLSFTGIIQVSLLVFSTDRTDALAYKYATLFEQSDKIVKIAASSFDKDGNVLQSSQIVTKADMNLIASGLFDGSGNVVSGAGLITKEDAAGMFVVNKDGKLVSMVGASASGVTIKGDQINMTTSNFRIKTIGGKDIAIFKEVDGTPLIKGEYLDVTHLGSGDGFRIVGTNDVNEGIFYNVTGKEEDRYGTFRFLPRSFSEVPRDALTQENDTHRNVLLFLQRARNNIYDRVLYASGISEFNGRVVISQINAEHTTANPFKPALFVEGGIGMRGLFHCEPGVGTQYLNWSSLIFVDKDYAYDMSLLMDDFAPIGTIVIFVCIGTTDWTLMNTHGSLCGRQFGETDQIRFTGDREMVVVIKTAARVFHVGYLN